MDRKRSSSNYVYSTVGISLNFFFFFFTMSEYNLGENTAGLSAPGKSIWAWSSKVVARVEGGFLKALSLAKTQQLTTWNYFLPFEQPPKSYTYFVCHLLEFESVWATNILSKCHAVSYIISKRLKSNTAVERGEKLIQNISSQWIFPEI